jgi:two-component system sensor kinase FixL
MSNPRSLKAALAKLSDQEVLAAEAERIAHIGTFVFDLDKLTAARSAEMSRIWGLEEREGPSDLAVILGPVHPDDHAVVISEYNRVLSTGGSVDREIRIITPQGDIRYVHLRAEVVQIKGRDGRFALGTVQDVTERRQAEELIAGQTRRLKEMQAELIFLARQSAMGTMAATLAHELNQPLTALATYAAGLRRALDTPNSVDLIREGIDAIEENSLRAGKIIRRMREMARQEGIRKERLDLAQLAQETAQFTAIGRDCLSFEYDFKHRSVVRADPIQIQQVLVNLLKNACEAVEEAGGGNIWVESADTDEGVRLCVIDSGRGIDPEILPSLFEARVSTKQQGMGIGLSISRTIVEAHGGRISAETSERGARFCFTLPAGD